MNEEPLAAAGPGDAFLGGRLLLRQPREGHRAGTDAVLLAAAAPREIGGQVLDVGAGVGAAGLALAALRPGVGIGLVEKDPALAALARDNLRDNHLAARGTVYAADVIDPASRREAGLAERAAALVITNPPFLEAARVRASPQEGRRNAHILPEGVSLADWILACLALLNTGGELIMIHRPDALATMLAALEGRAGAIVLKPIAPHQGKAAVRLLLRAKTGSRAPLSIAAPLILHDGSRFSGEAEALHRGDALLGW